MFKDFSDEDTTRAQSIASRVKDYLKRNQYRLDVNLRESSGAGYPSGGLYEMDYPGASKLGPNFKHRSKSKDGPVFISIAFTKKVLPSTSVEDLRNNLRFVTLDHVPMPGFHYPANWDITPVTPVSSFKDGVTIVSFKNGRIHYKVKTRFFSVYGRKSNLPEIPDSSSPKGSYFSVRKDIDGMIDVNMPLVFKDTFSS